MIAIILALIIGYKYGWLAAMVAMFIMVMVEKVSALSDKVDELQNAAEEQSNELEDEFTREAY